MKKFLSVLLALAMIFSLTVTVSADETKGEMDGYVVVLHTNDVHGAISGYAKVAALKKAYEAEGAYVLLMDAGDFCQGDPTVSVSQGKTAVELMNMAGYDVTTLGNHEFDYGYDNLVNLQGSQVPHCGSQRALSGEGGIQLQPDLHYAVRRQDRRVRSGDP